MERRSSAPPVASRDPGAEPGEPPDPVRTPTPELRKQGFAEEALPHLDAVVGFARRLTQGDEDEARDLTQETFLRAYRSWESYARGTNCRAWLFTICKNVFLLQRRRESHRPATVDIDADPAVEAQAATAVFEDAHQHDPELAFFDSFVDDEVLAAVDRLPAEFREAVVLSDMEGLSYAEIAEVLSIPVGTVKSRLYRGRRLLQQALYDYAREMGYLSRGRTR